MTRSTTTMPWDNDDALLNPFDEYLEEGRRQGRHEGLEAGYREGYELGQVTGLEYGMELGFVRGVVTALRQEDDLRPSDEAPWLSPNKRERLAKLLDELSSLLDQFPGPADVFHTDASSGSGDHEHDDDDEEAHSQRSHEGNVQVLLQKIRSKFKLLTVVLGIPRFSLTQVMDQAAADDSKHQSGVDASTNAPLHSEW